MSTRNLLGGGGLTRGQGIILSILTSSVSRMPRKHRSLDVSQTYEPLRPVTGKNFIFVIFHKNNLIE
jgi:hypothetical protein